MEANGEWWRVVWKQVKKRHFHTVIKRWVSVSIGWRLLEMRQIYEVRKACSPGNVKHQKKAVFPVATRGDCMPVVLRDGGWEEIIRLQKSASFIRVLHAHITDGVVSWKQEFDEGDGSIRAWSHRRYVVRWRVGNHIVGHLPHVAGWHLVWWSAY